MLCSVSLPLQASEATTDLKRQRQERRRVETAVTELRARLQACQADCDREKLAAQHRADRDCRRLEEVSGAGHRSQRETGRSTEGRQRLQEAGGGQWGGSQGETGRST